MCSVGMAPSDLNIFHPQFYYLQFWDGIFGHFGLEPNALLQVRRISIECAQATDERDAQSVFLQ